MTATIVPRLSCPSSSWRAGKLRSRPGPNNAWACSTSTVSTAVFSVTIVLMSTLICCQYNRSNICDDSFRGFGIHLRIRATLATWTRRRYFPLTFCDAAEILEAKIDPIPVDISSSMPATISPMTPQLVASSSSSSNNLRHSQKSHSRTTNEENNNNNTEGKDNNYDQNHPSTINTNSQQYQQEQQAFKEHLDIETDFLVTPLRPNEIQHVRWSDNNDIVAHNSYRLGLSSKIRSTLLDYAERAGVVSYMEKLTFGGLSNPAGTGRGVRLSYAEKNSILSSSGSRTTTVAHEEQQQQQHRYLSWYVQRPSATWKTNMHWVSPNGPETQRTYLEALGDAGFDDVLESLGRHFGFDGLAVYQVTFIGVSSCSQGFLHSDFTNTHPDPDKTKAFNIIIPLILPDDDGGSTMGGTMPAGIELASRKYDANNKMMYEVGYLQYKYDEAVMVGDDADHATAPVYHDRAMRLAATIYVADFNDDNYKNFPYDQPYPPVRDHPEMLLDVAGRDWHPMDPTRKLPKHKSSESSEQ